METKALEKRSQAGVPAIIGSGRKVSKLEEEMRALFAANRVLSKDKDGVPINRGIQIKDITAAAFLSAHGLIPTLNMQVGKVVFEFPGNERTLTLLEDYKKNPYIKAQDFVAQLKRLQAQIETMRK